MLKFANEYVCSARIIRFKSDYKTNRHLTIEPPEYILPKVYINLHTFGALKHCLYIITADSCSDSYMNHTQDMCLSVVDSCCLFLEATIPCLAGWQWHCSIDLTSKSTGLFESLRPGTVPPTIDAMLIQGVRYCLSMSDLEGYNNWNNNKLNALNATQQCSIKVRDCIHVIALWWHMHACGNPHSK